MKHCSFFFLCLISIPTFADVNLRQQPEVQHLLNFIEKSFCIIYRNGSKHTAQEAVEHIKKKYDYFRDEIKTTEDFILYAATKSTLTGNKYTVACPEKVTIKTQQWLLNELQNFRSNNIK